MICKLYTKYLCIILISLFITSCVQETIDDLSDINAVSGNPAMALPLVNAQIGIKELYKTYSDRGFVNEASDMFLTFVYQKRDSLESQQLITVPEVKLEYELKFDQGTANTFNTVGKLSNNFSSYAVLSTGNKEKMKGYKIRKGNFFADITCQFKHDAVVICTYPSITKNGRPLIDTIIVKYTGTFPFTVNKVINLDGYDVDLSDGGISYNVIPYLFELNLTKKPGETASENDKIKVSERFKIDEYQVIRGYLGKFDILNTTTRSRIDIFDRQIDGNLFLNDPKLVFTMQNSIGMPLTGRITNLRIEDPNGNMVPVTIDPFKDTFTLAYPSVIGQVINSEYTIDKTNSNIDKIISRAPQYILYDMVFTANYREEESSDNYLVWDNSFRVQGNVNIPLDLAVIKYELKSSGDLDLPKDEEGLEIQDMKLATFGENYMPFEVYIQAYFTKPALINGVDSFIVVDSLYKETSHVLTDSTGKQELVYGMKITGCKVDANGNIIGPGIGTDEVVANKSNLDFWKNCDKYLLKVRTNTSRFGTSGSPFVKVYGNQYINFKAGIQGKFKFNTKIKD